MPEKIIDRKKVKTAIDAFEEIFNDKVQSISARISTDRVSAPQSYISDMEGYHRGLLEMGNRALRHFKKQLLGTE